jgi:hypothetical protein
MPPEITLFPLKDNTSKYSMRTRMRWPQQSRNFDNSGTTWRRVLH